MGKTGSKPFLGYLFRIAIISLFLPWFAFSQIPAAKLYQSFLWHIENKGQPFRIDFSRSHEKGKVGADIDLLRAWQIQSQSPDVLVAILDGGFELGHEDLKSQFLTEQAFDFIERKKSFVSEDLYHGTLVAGILGANGENPFGVTGISQNVPILPLRVVPKGLLDEKDEDVAEAIRYAIDQGAEIINGSFGKDSTSSVVEETIRYGRERDVLFVFSAGNKGSDNDLEPRWPSNYAKEWDNVISVTATDRKDELWKKSNIGFRSVTLAAPGDEIFATIPFTETNLHNYGSASGTSMAAPVVSGIAALMKQKNIYLSPALIKRVLIETSDQLGGLSGRVRSGGRVNVYHALKKVSGRCVVRAKEKTLKQTEEEWLAVFDFKDRPKLWKNDFLRSEKEIEYFNWVQMGFSDELPYSAMNILRTHYQVIEEAIKKNPQIKTLKETLEGKERMLSLMAENTRRANCLETFFHSLYHKKYPLDETRSEFSAKILKSPNGKKLRAYVKGGRTGIVGVTKSAILEKLIRKDLKRGWKRLIDLHNHPLALNPKYGDYGPLSPSLSDIQNYQNEKPEEAIITNGIDSFVMEENTYMNL